MRKSSRAESWHSKKKIIHETNQGRVSRKGINQGICDKGLQPTQTKPTYSSGRRRNHQRAMKNQARGEPLRSSARPGQPWKLSSVVSLPASRTRIRSSCDFTFSSSIRIRSWDRSSCNLTLFSSNRNRSSSETAGGGEGDSCPIKKENEHH